MDKKYDVCYNCVDKYCCRGLCKELNEYLVNKNKFVKLDNKTSKTKTIEKEE